MAESKKPRRSIGDEAAIEKSSRVTIHDWALMGVDELLRIRSEILNFLPPSKLSELDIETELLLHFHATKTFYAKVAVIEPGEDDQVSVTAQVSAANSVAGILARVVELQNKVYTSERFKGVENALIRTLKKYPEALSEAFMKDYRAVLEHGKE